MDKTVSLILPSFNVTEHIERCLTSVLKQSYSDLEILAIDADSTDGTLDIIKKIAENDSRIRVLLSEKKSYGYQVNVGIKEAKGDYIGVIETDDFIEPDMISYLYELLEESGADFAKVDGEQYLTLPNGEVFREKMHSIPQDSYSKYGGVAEIIPREFPQILWWDSYLWNGLYKKQLIQKIRLSETPGAAYQDTGFMLQLFTNAGKGIYSDRTLYHYSKDNDSASFFSVKAFDNLAYEYTKLEKYLEGKETKWKTQNMVKLFEQILTRFYTMGFAGRFFVETTDSIICLQNMLRRALDTGILSEKDFRTGTYEKVEGFIQDYRSPYEECKEYADRSKRQIDIIRERSNGKKAVIFGAGNYGEYVRFILLALGREISAVCDNRAEEMHVNDRIIQVITPECATRDYPDSVFIIAAGVKNRKQMRNQIISLGISEEQIVEYEGGISGYMPLLYAMKQVGKQRNER